VAELASGWKIQLSVLTLRPAFLNVPGPALLEAVVDPLEPPLPPKIKAEQALHVAQTALQGIETEPAESL